MKIDRAIAWILALLMIPALLMTGVFAAATEERPHHLPPEGPYAALIASLREAVARGNITMPRALEGWLVSRTSVVDGGLEVAVPMFVEARPGLLSRYEGEEPSIYMQVVIRQLAEQMMLLPMDADVGRIFVPEGIEPSEALVQALISVGEEMDQWIGDQLSHAKAYGALTRLTFDLGDMNKSDWRSVRFPQKAQAPVYGDQHPRRTIREGDAGPSIRAAQEALLDQGFLDADRATGTFSPKMLQAVLAFQAKNGLPETGELTPAEQYLLLGQLPPYSLAEALAQGWNREADFAAWWPSLVRGLHTVSWSGSTVTVTIKDYMAYQDQLFAFLMRTILFEGYSVEDLDELMAYALRMLHEDDSGDLEKSTVSFSITLDALRSGGPRNNGYNRGR